MTGPNQDIIVLQEQTKATEAQRQVVVRTEVVPRDPAIPGPHRLHQEPRPIEEVPVQVRERTNRIEVLHLEVVTIEVHHRVEVTITVVPEAETVLQEAAEALEVAVVRRAVAEVLEVQEVHQDLPVAEAVAAVVVEEDNNPNTYNKNLIV